VVLYAINITNRYREIYGVAMGMHSGWGSFLLKYGGESIEFLSSVFYITHNNCFNP
jgi:hypothetical protein